MIPGFVIAWLTFPGVVVHEFAHALFCILFKVPIYEVCYMRLTMRIGQPIGYVVHGHPDKAWKGVMISVGPFIVNTVLGALIAMPAALPVWKFHSGDVLDYFLLWLGCSIAMHAFPSTGDARAIWATVTRAGTPFLTKLIAVPIVGFIYVGAIGSFFWLDALYGVAVSSFVPQWLVSALA